MSENTIEYPATVIVHWPGQSTGMCDEHEAKAARIAGAMGMPTPTSTPVTEPTECKNCINEANK